MTRPRLPLAALLCAATLWLAGCVQTDDDVTVKPDGSGSFTESMVVDLAVSAELAEAIKALPPPPRGPGAGMDGGDPPPEPPAPPPPDPAAPPEGGAKPADAPTPPTDPLERLKARWKDIPGLEVTKATSETKEGKAHLTIAATFQTLEAYAQATGIEMGSSLVKNEDASYTLSFEMRFPGRGRRPDGGRREGPGPGMGEEPPGGMEDGGMDGGEPPRPRRHGRPGRRSWHGRDDAPAREAHDRPRVAAQAEAPGPDRRDERHEGRGRHDRLVEARVGRSEGRQGRGAVGHVQGRRARPQAVHREALRAPHVDG